MPHIPVHPSAEKRQRQNLKRREHNRKARTQVRTAVKVAAEAIVATDAAAAQETASRKIGRLSAQFHKTHAAKA
jgi:ribosomal protein S20